MLSYIQEVIRWAKQARNQSGSTTNQRMQRHLYAYRKNSEFGERVREFKSRKGTSLNHLITKLLAEHWGVPSPMPHMDYD